ncbi:MAG: SpoVR family protein [Bdellovibrionales bacterium]|nr:SpoVR family protein [Bdellovibrionales bacterium]
MQPLPDELEDYRQKICKLAEEAGLDFFETIFEMVSYDQLNQIAAYGGFPVRYPHWRFGMQYEQLSKSYRYGLSKIYELVINTDPCIAYLMDGNDITDQKLVMAHVYGHCDFFKNNLWFSKTNRKMIDQMANHATRIRNYMDRYGVDVVEDFIDICLSIENLIDPHSVFVDKKIEPKVEIKLELDPAKKEEMAKQEKFPFDYPERDVLNFLIYKAPLENWQQDVLSIIRTESYYFAPQMMTKIMNEGWASYWHAKLMTEKIIGGHEIINFADRHSGTMSMNPGGFNPYKVGLELFRNIKTRWDRGQFGKEWSECENMVERSQWDKQLGLGEKKIFEVRRTHNDVTFIDEFLTEEFCVENKMFVYKFNKRTNQYEIDTRNFKEIKAKLVFQLTNSGQPIIKVLDGNYEGKGELLLDHLHVGVDLQPSYMKETMANVYKLWKKPIHVKTTMEDDPKMYTFDGEDLKETSLSKADITHEKKDLPKGEEKK